MGCFSYLCNECGKGILSNSFRGELVKLFYIKDGKVIEQMQGEYDSYGCVFIEGTQCKDVKYPLRESQRWEHDEEIRKDNGERHYAQTLAYYDREFQQRYEEWKDHDPIRAELAHSQIQTDPLPIRDDCGIAAIHVRCYKEDPTIISMDDPDQGWGSEDDEVCLLGSVDDTLDVEGLRELVTGLKTSPT